MNLRTLLTTALLLLVAQFAFADDEKDSTIHVATPTHYSFSVVTRLNSKGMFGYTGRIVSNDPSFDVNIRYERTLWGYTFFKAFDLRDCHAENNFTLTSLFFNIRVGNKLKFVPQIAFRLGQTHAFMDKDSDAIFFLTTSYKLLPKLTIEHTGIFANVIREQQSFDWVNRFRLLYAAKHLELAAMLYNNTSTFNDDSYVSGALQCAYGHINLSKHVFLSAGITGVKMLRDGRPGEFLHHDGVMFTLAGTFH